MASMLPSGIDIRIREDLVAGVGRTQTTLIIDPIITLDGHRVTMTDIGDKGYGKLEQGTPREELMSWTGITDNGTTYTLTGCVWGINFYNLVGGVQANKWKHNSGSSFKITTDMHFIAEQYRSNDSNVFESADDFEIKSNTVRIGDGTNDEDKTIYAQNADANKPFMRYDETLGKWIVSNDGVNSYDPEQGGSGATAGDGIDIVGGVVSVNLDQLVDDEALDTTANRLTTKIKDGGYIIKDSDGLSVETAESELSNFEKITSGSNISDISKFTALSNPTFGLMTGSDKYTINPFPYINEAISDNITTYNKYTSFYNTYYSQSFITGTKPFLSKVSLAFYPNDNSGYYTGYTTVMLYACDANDKPTGSPLSIKQIVNNGTNFPFAVTWVDFDVNVAVLPSTKYCIVVKSDSYGSSYYNRLCFNTSSIYSNGMFASSSNSGASWTTNSSYDIAFKTYYKDSLTTIDDFTDAVEAAIQSETGKDHTFEYINNKFVFTSANEKELAFFYDAGGDDISGDTDDGTGKNFLDITINATNEIGFQAPGFLLSGTNASRLKEWSELLDYSTVIGNISGGVNGTAIQGTNKNGMVFWLEKTTTLTDVTALLIRQGTPTGDFVVEVFEADSNFAAVGSAIDSITVPCSSINSGVDNTFTFNRQLTGQKNYIVCFSAPSGNGSNYFYGMRASQFGQFSSLVYQSYYNGSWGYSIYLLKMSVKLVDVAKQKPKFNIEIDNTLYENNEIELKAYNPDTQENFYSGVSSDNIQSIYGGNRTSVGFLSTGGVLKEISIYGTKTGSTTGDVYIKIYKANSFVIPYGDPIKTILKTPNDFNGQIKLENLNLMLVKNQYYCIEVSYPLGDISNFVSLRGQYSTSNIDYLVGITSNNWTTGGVIKYSAYLIKYEINLDEQETDKSVDYSGGNFQVYGSYWASQSFIAHTNKLKSVKFRMKSPGSQAYTIALYAANAEHEPTGAAIDSKTVTHTSFSQSWQTIQFEQTLVPGTEYCIVISAPAASNYAVTMYHGTASGDGYMATSSNSGSSWDIGGNDFAYVIYEEYLGDKMSTSLEKTLQANVSSDIEVYDIGNRFVVLSGTSGKNSSVKKMTAPTTGSDVSGLTQDSASRNYFDCATNATEYLGSGSDNKIVVADNDGLLPEVMIPDMVDYSSSLTRLNGTVYQNKSYRSKMIIATVTTTAGAGSGDYFGQVIFSIGSTSSPATAIATAKTKASGDRESEDTRTVTFIVPPRWYYKYVTSVNGSGSAATVNSLYEVNI